MSILIRALKWFCFIILFLLVLLLAFNVVMRYIINAPIHWAEEAGMLLLIWVTFIGSVLTALEKKHLGMDLLLNKLNKKISKVISGIISLLTIIALLIIVYFGVDIVIYNISLKSESLKISYAFFYLPIPLGCLIYALVESYTLIKSIKKVEA